MRRAGDKWPASRDIPDTSGFSSGFMAPRALPAGIDEAGAINDCPG
jgi:hypothetical protein